MVKIESVVEYVSHKFTGNHKAVKHTPMVQVTVNMPKSSFPYFKQMISRKQNKKEMASADAVDVLRRLRAILHGVSI